MTTQYANATYEEIIDLHTEADKVSVVGIHTPDSDTPYHMLKGFWTQFKKFKYNGCSIAMVPAARLPADPLQVSYDPGETTIDPRDMLNPILFHGCHGDDMGSILNSLYTDDSASSFIEMMRSDSVDHNIFPRSVISGIGDTEVYEALYYKAMTDKTWLKAHPQRGFRKNGLRPMVYSLATSRQLSMSANPGGTTGPYGTIHNPNTGEPQDIYEGVSGQKSGSDAIVSGLEFGRPEYNPVNNSIFMSRVGHLGVFTPRLQRLGWMDTRNVRATIPYNASSTAYEGMDAGDVLASMYSVAKSYTEPALVPKIYMGMIMLPPAYKTEQYFRLIITHSFSFAKFRGASMNQLNLGEWQKAYNVYDFNDTSDDAKARRENLDLEKQEVEFDGSEDV